MKGQKLDNKFTNRAWAEMSGLLDREMPVKDSARSRRIAGWWWLLTGLCLGAGMAAFWFSTNDKQQLPAPVEQTGAETQNRTVAETIAPVSGAAGSMEKSKAVEPVASMVPVAHAAFSGVTADLPNELNHSTFSKGNVATSVHNTLDEDETISTVIPIDAKPEIFPRFSVEQLAYLAIAPLSERQPELRVVVAPPLHGKSFPELLAYASALTSPVSGSNGLGAGVLASFHFKNPRLSLETGLGYTYIRQPLSILAPEEADPTNTNPIQDEHQQVLYGFGDLTSKATRLESGYLLATQDLGLHYAEVPLHLAFQASPKWQFFAGANFLVLLESSPGFTEGGLLNALDPGLLDMSSGGGGPFVNGISSNTLHVPLSGFDAQFSAGARYRLSRSLVLGLQYQTGMVDVVKSNGAADYHHLTRLTLFHRLGR